MTNEELRSKILNDIQYIKDKAEAFQKRLVDFKLDESQLQEIRSVLNYFRTKDFTFVSTLNNQEQLLNLENQFSPYKISIETFLDGSTQQRLNNFLANNSKIYEYMEYVINAIEEQFTPVIPKNKTDEFTDLQKRVNDLETNWKYLSKDLETSLSDFKKKSEDQIVFAKHNFNEILKISSEVIDPANKIKKIYEETKDTTDEIKKLKIKCNETLNHNVSMVLSDQFQEKAKLLKEEVEIKLGIFSWKPWNFKGFRGAILIFLFVNIVSWTIYFSSDLNIDFWQYMMLKLTINLPLIIYVAFALNEYTKAKKSYEEFDYKRIMAITLVNNYKMLKDELGLEEDKAFQLIKVPFEKIFDNPVHSIYGDKSGDKNIGLDQLEKITSIIEKMKK